MTMKDDLTSAIERTTRNMQVVTAAMLVSVCVITCLPSFVVWESPGPMSPDESDLVESVLIGAALLGFAAASWMPRLHAFRIDSKGGKEALQTIFTVHMASLALKEVPAIFGLILAVACGKTGWGLALGALSIAAVAYSFPREGEIRRRVESAEAARARRLPLEGR